MELGSKATALVMSALSTAARVNITPPSAEKVWTYGPPVIDLFGARIPLISMGLGLFGLAMARGIKAARDGAEPGRWYITGLLYALMIALVIERQPTPGVAVMWGGGLGIAGLLVVNLMGEKIVSLIKGFDISKIGAALAVMFGTDKPKAVDSDDTAAAPLETKRETE